MGIPHGDDVMLNYQTTGFRETAALRELFGLTAIAPFQRWLETHGLRRGRQTDRAGRRRLGAAVKEARHGSRRTQGHRGADAARACSRANAPVPAARQGRGDCPGSPDRTTACCPTSRRSTCGRSTSSRTRPDGAAFLRPQGKDPRAPRPRPLRRALPHGHRCCASAPTTPPRRTASSPSWPERFWEENRLIPLCRPCARARTNT